MFTTADVNVSSQANSTTQCASYAIRCTTTRESDDDGVLSPHGSIIILMKIHVNCFYIRFRTLHIFSVDINPVRQSRDQVYNRSRDLHLSTSCSVSSPLCMFFLNAVIAQKSFRKHQDCGMLIQGNLQDQEKQDNTHFQQEHCLFASTILPSLSLDIKIMRTFIVTSEDIISLCILKSLLALYFIG